MIMGPIDDSQRKAAKAAGFAFLISFAIVVFVQFGIHDRLIVAGNPAETARNLMAHERLFRIGIAGDLIYCAAVIILLAALYVILKPVSPGLALLAALGRLIYALMWVLMTLNIFDVLRLLSGAHYVRAFEADRLQALAWRSLGASFDQYYVGLLFAGLASTVCGYLWLKSGYIPRVLGAFGLIASAWCAACTFVFIIDPGVTKVVNLWWFDSPWGISEIAISLWLLFKGLRRSEVAGLDQASDRARTVGLEGTP